MSVALRIPSSEFAKMKDHAAEAYPEECCGFLIGVMGEDKEVAQVRRAQNVHREARQIRYTIDPREQMRLERELDGKGMQIVGFYHAHPDHPAKPSLYDRDHAWPLYSYLILSVFDANVIDARSLVLNEDQRVFEEERLVEI